MSDWDTTTKIGKSVNRGGGGGSRETVVRNQSALNAARRSGASIATEKKYVTGNLTTKSGMDGQKLAKVDRTDDVVKVEKIPKEVKDAIVKARLAMQINGSTMTQPQLADKIGEHVSLLQSWEAGTAAKPKEQQLAKLERVLNVKLRGKDIGKPKFEQRGKK